MNNSRLTYKLIKNNSFRKNNCTNFKNDNKDVLIDKNLLKSRFKPVNQNE